MTGFGRLLDAVEQLGLLDDTVVIFTSDNGPAITAMHPHGSAGKLRDKKGTVYEGWDSEYQRIVRWPGKSCSRRTESDVPCQCSRYFADAV